MKLSTKSRYGVRAVIEIARNYGGKPSRRKDISEHQDISQAYLENILIMLKNGNIIDTRRGAGGGFVLKRHPSKITLKEIITVLEGSLAFVECVENPARCSRSDRCSTFPLWKKMYDHCSQLLDGITLQELVEKEKKWDELHYSI